LNLEVGPTTTRVSRDDEKCMSSVVTVEHYSLRGGSFSKIDGFTASACVGECAT